MKRKRRIILNIYEDDITDEQAVALMSQVIDGGRVSATAGRKHYCHLSVTATKIMIHSTKRADSTDTFSIYRQPA